MPLVISLKKVGNIGQIMVAYDHKPLHPSPHKGWRRGRENGVLKVHPSHSSGSNPAVLEDKTSVLHTVGAYFDGTVKSRRRDCPVLSPVNQVKM